MEVDWAYLMADLVRHLVKIARNAKSKAGTPLSPYLAHLHVKNELLKPGKQQNYDEFLDIQNYGGMESKSGKESKVLDLPAPSLTSSPRPPKRSQPRGT